jgi:hypothetical protein
VAARFAPCPDRAAERADANGHAAVGSATHARHALVGGSRSSRAAPNVARLRRRPISKASSIASTNVPRWRAIHGAAASREAKKWTEWQKLAIVSASKRPAGRRNDGGLALRTEGRTAARGIRAAVRVSMEAVYSGAPATLGLDDV